MDIDKMTPRQRTYALKRFGIRIDSAMENLYPEDWEITFNDGVQVQVHCISSWRAWDGIAACEREARQIATRDRLEKLMLPTN